MSDEKATKPVNVDPRCIQEALRAYFQPIKNEDPQLDFYTMYKREATEYDTEYMRKYNEDLNTTLIFAGLFSAVSSAFVIDVQSKLQPDPAERSEAYLRAILLTLNRSISPNEDPTAPPVWNGSPTEVVTTSNLLYASLLMSLLAAFVAMLGKQWLNRYLRHTGGSMVERCGDRQRKCDGLEKWPFHFFIESLPVMLQIALLLLASGLSRYMWSINTSVARVVISSTVLGILFYIGIVIAGTSSYECPFQTPASMTLRAIRHSRTPQKLLVHFSPLSIASFLHNALAVGQKSCASGIHRIRNAVANRPPWEMLLSEIWSWVCGVGQKIGHRIIILLLRADRRLGNIKHRVIQSIRRFRRATLLPTIHDDAGSFRAGLFVTAPNLEALRRLNADNARCVSWILRNITDPEAIDSAVRLASGIRWFDGDIDVDLPFDVVISTFNACFDSDGELYPGMRDRAYLSGRAILQINAHARRRSHECESKYPIPQVTGNHIYWTDGDLRCIVSILEDMGPSAGDGISTFIPLRDGDSLWLSNLLIDLARAHQILSPTIFRLLCAVQTTHNQATNANLFLAWYLFLGGEIEEETFWVVDKSSDLGLFPKVEELIPDPSYLQYLGELLDFLATWESPPWVFAGMAYDWCSTISEKLRELDQGKAALENRLSPHNPGSSHPQDETADNYAALLLRAIEIGFRRFNLYASSASHTPHHHWMFDIIFSSDNDEFIETAVYAWVVDRTQATIGSYARRFSVRVEKAIPFSDGLRRAITRVIEDCEPTMDGSELDIARLLNLLNLDVGNLVKGDRWQRILVGVIRSPMGRENLSLHNWCLLGELALAESADLLFELGDVDVEVSELLRGREDWEKLEVWALVIWSSFKLESDEQIEDIKRLTLGLLPQRPSALQRFKSLYELEECIQGHQLREICDQAQVEQLSSTSSPKILGPSSVPFPFVGDDTF